MTDIPPDPAPGAVPIAAPNVIANARGASSILAPYALALACLAAVVFDPNLQSSADTVLKLVLGAALMAINPGAKSGAPR